jgi:hypothetical protein
VALADLLDEGAANGPARARASGTITDTAPI